MKTIFHLTCPNCGSRVPVYSATSVLVVCEYCHSALLRDGESAQYSGRKSEVLEDYSPIQLHTSGVYDSVPFEVIGRIQLHYDLGFWNEWYVIFANGSCGWLSDSGWQYTMTKLAPPLPTEFYPFHELAVGSTRLSYDNQVFVASDVRESQGIKANAQGELPFGLFGDWKVEAADFRSGSHFITLDYTDAPAKHPIVYVGKSVSLKDLHCQMLRTPEQIVETAGKLKGETVPFACPNCGASLKWIAGVATNIVCPSCHSDLDLSDGTAKLLARHAMRLSQQNQARIKLGERARIGGVLWTVIGMIRCQELDDAGNTYNRNSAFSRSQYEAETMLLMQSVEWYEYLLYHPQHGFRWIVDSEEGWELIRSVDRWPAMDKTGQPVLSNKSFRKGYDYGSKVLYAAGAFYWRVLPGDVTYISDYVHKNEKLSIERNHNEMSWSWSVRVENSEVADWFKRPELAKTSFKNQLGKTLSISWLDQYSFLTIGLVAVAVMVLINLVFLTRLSFEDMQDVLIIGAGAILIPINLGSIFDSDD